MQISEILPAGNILPCLRVKTKLALLRLLAEKAASATHLPLEIIFQAVLHREELGSTGVGGGIAMPHARISGLTRPVAFFARLDHPVEYESIDGRSVDLLFFLLLPDSSDGSNLQLLAQISRRLRDQDRTSQLRRTTDPAQLLTLLLEPVAER